MEARELATRVLTEVISNRKHLDLCLDEFLRPVEDKRTRSLTREICYGVMRWYIQLEFIVNQLVSKPLKDKDTDLFALLLTGIYQINFLRTPDYAAINESVETAKIIGKPWAANLINGVLRTYQRDMNVMQKKISESDSIRYSFPDWMLEKIIHQWPDNWKDILTASNQYPPMHLRLDTSRQSRQSYLQVLKSSGIDAEISEISVSGIRLTDSLNVEHIPGFIEGDVSVQDFGAQLAAPLLDCRPGQRVLDACAAPGGKTCHILETTPEISELVAVDIDPNRLALLRNNLGRTGKVVTVYQADVCDSGSWWDNTPFDRILLDAPCTASGIIRRHPDIKYLRQSDQLSRVLSSQILLLDSLWSMLKSGGKLVYSTCSLFTEESGGQIAQFMNRYNNVKIRTINADWGVSSDHGRHTLPGCSDTDGFYYSVLEKT